MVKKLNKIMLIDDDMDINFYTQILLKKLNVCEEVIVYQNARDALKYLKNNKGCVDFIFVDINMPIMNGWEFLEECKKITTPENKLPKIIMVTSSININDKKEAEQYNFIEHFVNKPLTKDKLSKILSLG